MRGAKKSGAVLCRLVPVHADGPRIGMCRAWPADFLEKSI
jgi:hypothetical protein